MIHLIEGDTAAQLYEEGLHKLRICGMKTNTRNGQAIAMPDMTIIRLNDPTKRIIDDPVRRANPFFHLMEFVWMMAGRSDLKWIQQFNKGFETYADDGVVKAAYGYRWRNEFGRDQIAQVIEMLAKDSGTRQAVIQMWSPTQDLWSNHKDKACNVGIFFRYTGGALDCTVFNRSNDFVWGALGANVCHLTMLHECVAYFSGLPLGRYTVVSNNLHIYTGMPRFYEIFDQRSVNDIYKDITPRCMFRGGDTYRQFVEDCEQFCQASFDSIDTPWLKTTALPAYYSWMLRSEIDIGEEHEYAYDIESPDWRIACLNYKERILSSATSTEPSP